MIAPRSLRARLTLWYTTILALMLIAFAGVSYVLLSREIRLATDSSLSDTAHEFAAAFGRDSSGNAVEGRLDFRYSDREIIVFTPDGKVVAESRNRLRPAERAAIGAIITRRHRGFLTVAGGRENDGVRVFATPVQVVGRNFVAVVARDLDEQTDRLESARSALFVGIPVALLVAAAGGYLLARKSLEPVTAMSMKARHISAETLGQRIEVPDRDDELGFLASTLNDLLERLQRAFESQKRFMADASHELRTPVSIIQGEADVALERSDRSPEEYRESIEVMRKAGRKLTNIVQDLFLLARSDAGSYPMTISRFYLDELLADCVRSMRSVAAARGVDVKSNCPSDLILEADEELTQRLVVNLLANAIRFTPSGGLVRVQTSDSADTYTITVTDTGTGILPADQPRIFERFFRGDRTRKHGAQPSATGAGLGLPIARWIAEEHGGQLQLERSGPDGTVFILTIPKVAVSPAQHGNHKPATPPSVAG